jgi:predicted small lipoprotein YifL
MLRAAALIACLLLAACGQKGDLYLPSEERDAVIVPVTPASSPVEEPADGNDRQRRNTPAPNPTGN